MDMQVRGGVAYCWTWDDDESVVKRQLALAWLVLRRESQAATARARAVELAMRRSRHWLKRTASSDSARLSQLPCLGL
jgi:hypothetical protein